MTRLITTVRLSDTNEKQLEEVLRQAKLLLTGTLKPVTAPDYEGMQSIRQPQKRLTPDDVVAIGEEYRSGLSMREIAELRKLNRETVALALQRAGVKARRPRALTEKQLSEASALYSEGWSLNRLGKRYGLDPKTMKKRLASIQ